MKRLALFLVLCIVGWSVWAQTAERAVKPVKNVIVMIPDGTSIGVVSAARYFKMYTKNDGHLNLDPLICGTVSTFCSNAPIGDSAPTTSCYMSGVPSWAGFVSTYPPKTENDLVPIDATRAYQPLATVLEASRILKNKATGLVVTCEFPHATPADCSAHCYQRNNYKYIAPQMAYNDLDVMFGGGTSIVTDDMREHFKANGTTLLNDDLAGFRSFNGDGKLWALFYPVGTPYDLDRDPAKMPSLAEMTRKAIDRLSKKPEGFFLMVEGSDVDHAAHANDPVGCITEFIAFDDAVGVALDFARKNGETAVVILPDHGNSGFTIGKRECGSSKNTLTGLFGTVAKFKRTSEGLAEIVKTTKPEQLAAVMKEYTDLDLSADEIAKIRSAKDYALNSADYTKAADSHSLSTIIKDVMNAHTCFGFTTGGHTAEEVFLAAYHPDGDIPTGRNTNVEINHYLCKALGFDLNTLPTLTDKIFAKHNEVLKNYTYSLDKSGVTPVLTVKKGRNTLVIRANTSVAYLNKKPVNLGSVTVYVDKNDTFYLPANLLEIVKL